jgi:hypothetical protein
MNDTDQVPAYRVSTFCTSGGCVEVGHAPDGVTVRDAKDPLRAVAITFTTTSWAAFLGGVRSGDFVIGAAVGRVEGRPR